MELLLGVTENPWVQVGYFKESTSVSVSASVLCHRFVIFLSDQEDVVFSSETSVFYLTTLFHRGPQNNKKATWVFSCQQWENKTVLNHMR